MSTTASPLRESRPAAPPFAAMLRGWRHRRRVSQLELSLSCGVSQRHLSFLESGRSVPSRSMVFHLCDALDVPLRERNAWLLAAGFAPVFAARGLDDPEMTQVLAAIERMLRNHEPFPALAVDRAWNVRLSNRAFDTLIALLGDDVWTRTGCEDRNLLRLLFHPQGIRPWIANWSSVAPLLWHRAVRESESAGGEDVATLLAELRAFQEERTLAGPSDLPLVPVLPVVIERNGLTISLFTVISTFGTAQDATAEELRIESFFPSDRETEAIFERMPRHDASG